jgi:hypothetical protein
MRLPPNPLGHLSRVQQIRRALAIGFLGAALIVISFQATSSRAFIVTNDEHQIILICLDDKPVFYGATQDAPPVGLAHDARCGQSGHPAAIVTLDYQPLLWIGALLLFMSTGWQIALAVDAKES